jgi:DNA polymerase-1
VILILAVDTETTGLGYHDLPFLVSTWGEGGGKVYFLPEDTAEVRDVLAAHDLLVFHNAKFDLQKLILAGVIEGERPVADTIGIIHLINEHASKKLSKVVEALFGEEPKYDKQLKAYIAKKSNGIQVKSEGYSKVPRNILVPYAIEDARYTYLLYKLLWPKLQKYPPLVSLFESEMELVWALLAMEADGLRVDIDYVGEQIKEQNGIILQADMDISDATGLQTWEPDRPGRKTPEGCFNPSSWVQIKEFYHRKGVDRKSYNKDALVAIDDDFARALLARRKASKLVSTYLNPISKEAAVDGYLHPNIRQFGTVTGRMSSGEVDNV